MLLLLGCLLLPAAGAAPALAAETTIGFDDLAPGSAVSSQYQSKGLKLGHASDFGQTSPGAGDCGSPTVQAGTVAAPAASSPNYAVLATCPGAGPPISGAYGALLSGPSGSLSVQVRDLTVGAAAEIQLIGYDAAGSEVASGEAEADTAGWHKLTAALTGAGQISYLMIRTATGGSSSIAIDDLSFQGAAEEPGKTGSGGEPGKGGSGAGGGGGSGATGGGAPPPKAALTLLSSGPAGGAVTLSGAGSSAGSGRIISYDWDFNGDGHIDTSTATNPVARFIAPPGVHTIALTVTNSGGERSTTHLTVPSLAPALSIPDGGEGPCQPTYDEGNVHIVAECVQTLEGGGHVIRTRLLELNGVVLAPHAGGYGIFKIQSVREIGVGGDATRLSGPLVDVELLNTPIGDVVLGGRDLQSEPIQLAFKSFVNQHVPMLSHGLAPAHAAGATGKSLIMSFAAGQECSGAQKGATCCPKHQNTSCATLPGGFPLAGQVNAYLDNKGEILLDVQVALDLSSVEFEATGSLEIIASASSGIDLGSLQFTVPEAGLAHVFQVKDASFTYDFPDDPEESKRDSWQAKGTIVFGPLGEPSMSASLSFKKGQFKEASMTFTAPTGTGVPIYPGVLVNQLGGTIGVEPLKFGGTLGASIATQLQLSLSFLYREATPQELGFFGGQGKLSFQGDEIATLAADVYSDGYTDAKLKIDLHFPFSSTKPDIEIGGEIGFWDEPASGRWEADGNVHLKLWVINAEVAGLINNTYAAGCLSAFGGGIQGSYRFSDGNVSGGLFGFKDCSDELKQYREAPISKHSGGFVSAARAHGGAKARARAAAEASAGTIAVPSGQFGEELLISSAQGTPVVTLTAPDGTRYTTPVSPGAPSGVEGRFISAVAPNPHQVLVLLMHPKGGHWGIAPVAGSPPIASVKAAADVPPARIHVHVAHRHGRHFTLAYRISNHVKGMRVQLVERGRDSTNVIATVHEAKGTVQFTPQDAIGRARTVYAYVLSAAGVPRRTVAVGRFKAPAAVRAGRIHRVHFHRRGESVAVLSWSAAPGAREYRVRVHGSDGRLITLLSGVKHRSVRIPEALPWDSYSASVTALGGPNLLAGPSAHARLSVVRSHPRRSARRRRTPGGSGHRRRAGHGKTPGRRRRKQ